MASSYFLETAQVVKVYDCDSGEDISSAKFIGDDRHEVIKLRDRIKRGIVRKRPIVLCSECGFPVYLVTRPIKDKFFFRHTIEDGTCSLKTRGKLSQREIYARKYNGQKEGAQHIHMKELLCESIQSDKRFSEPIVEKRWNSDEGTWRQPDVQTYFDGVRFAFEVQLSTTFIDVIVERREFYLTERGFLFWIFKNFDPSSTRMTEEDIFHTNNCNIFVVDEETCRISQIRKKLHFRCFWSEPKLSEEEIINIDKSKIICFDDIHRNSDLQQAFYYDYEFFRKIIFDKLKNEKKKRMVKGLISHLNKRRENRYRENRNQFNREWSKFVKEYSDIIELPSDIYEDKFYQMACFLCSSMKGVPVGYRHKKLIEILHLAHSIHKPLLLLFISALKYYSRYDDIKNNEKWIKKRKDIKQSIKKDDSRFNPQRRWDYFVENIFPDVYKEYKKIIRWYEAETLH